jgi:hypothetical protein
MESSGAEMTQEPLGRLLEQFEIGTIQVPEFQRDVALKDDWVKHLLASVSLAYPIGAVMLLDAGNPEVRFETHAINGAPQPVAEPSRVLVDGQHRMSALYQALMSGSGVTIGGTEPPMKRWYYIDARAAIDPNVDRDVAILSMAAESVGERGLFPLRLIFGPESDLKLWKFEFIQAGPSAGSDSRSEWLREFEEQVLNAFREYHVPAFRLHQATTRWTVRMRGGAAGPALSDKFRVRPASRRQP